MRGRHWQKISAVAGFTVAPTEEESLHNLLQEGLKQHEKVLQDLSDSASREHALEKQLDKMQAEWVRAFFIARVTCVERSKNKSATMHAC